MSLYLYLCSQEFGVLRGVGEEDMATIADLLKTRNCDTGTVLCVQGEVADSLYLIQSGTVEVINQVSDQSRVRLAVRREGDSIGEMALIDDERRGATVCCLEPVRVLVLRRRDLQGLITTNPQLYIKIMMNLLREVSGRLRDADRVSSSALFIRA